MSQDLQPALKKRLIAPKILALLSFLLLGFLCAGYLLYQNYLTLPNTQTQESTIIIERGIGAEKIVDLLAEDKLIRFPWLFKLAAFVQKKHHLFKAGEYLFPTGATAQEVLDKLAQGKVVRHQLTFREGLRVDEILQMIANEKLLTGAIPADVKEGSILPETYFFLRGDSRASLVKRMQDDLQKTLQELWAQRIPNPLLPTEQDALILASIVEKETGIASERGLVASVFLNRLKIGMRLQSDPTTLYGVFKTRGISKQNLTSQELATPTAYNTYTINGLPPTPIANVGRAALQAVLSPPSSDFLYFVANGKGGHNFARTLAEHNHNVAAYYKGLSRP